MQILFTYFERWSQQEGIKNFTLELEKFPNGAYKFTLTPEGRESNLDTSLSFALTQRGITPMDNRKQYNS